jgi:hypothetical protein
MAQHDPPSSGREPGGARGRGAPSGQTGVDNLDNPSGQSRSGVDRSGAADDEQRRDLADQGTTGTSDPSRRDSNTGQNGERPESGMGNPGTHGTDVGKGTPGSDTLGGKR